VVFDASGLRDPVNRPWLECVNRLLSREVPGAGLRTGFRSATKDWVFYTDGDGQYDVRELAKLWSLVADGVDGVNGYKTRRADNAARRIIGKLYNAVVRFLFRLKIRDVDCDFRLLRRKAVESLSLTARSGGICVDLMRQIQYGGFRILETPVNHFPRAYGESQFFRVLPVARTGWDLLRLWFRSFLPKRKQGSKDAGAGS
jgi:glycosyltransferase involved in cell wall biosynthesis